ncbi:MAG: alpha-amylase family glycosyl hydrolase [Parvularculaceae bacterium]
MTNAPTQSGAKMAPLADVCDAEWWRGAVIYQIYPRSFVDTNSDGVGDLPGILSQLDYVAQLGVDGIWLSPFFTSPMHDFGYDVANYCDVDPVFGSLEDFDAIIAKSHDLGLKVIIDQVYSHTSDQHAWFQESQQDKTNPKADWFVWADPKLDGAPPNNWQSVFGGPAWAWSSRRKQYYLHNFLTEQPDLNLHNKVVQDALLEVARFWLDRGVDGFRLDAINFAMHDPALRDNPPAPDDGRPKSRPYDYQSHTRNMSHPDIPIFLKRLRAVTNEYDGIFTVAEVGGPNPVEEMKAFTADNDRLNSAYNFSFLYADQLTPQLTRMAVGAWRPDKNEGWPAWAFSNHDAPRAVSRWADADDANEAAKLYAMILLSLRGNAFIYQGEELGLPQANVPFEMLQDPEAIENWPHTLGRDGARTPMPWRHNKPNAGFSNGAPWLPVDQKHLMLSVDIQEADKDSTLNFMRRLIAARKATACLRHGDIAFVDDADGMLAYYRNTPHEEALCVFNITDTPRSWKPLGANQFERLIDLGIDPAIDGLPQVIQPRSGYIAIKSR